jgi:hypothetical protein
MLYLPVVLGVSTQAKAWRSQQSQRQFPFRWKVWSLCMIQLTLTNFWSRSSQIVAYIAPGSHLNLGHWHMGLRVGTWHVDTYTLFQSINPVSEISSWLYLSPCNIVIMNTLISFKPMIYKTISRLQGCKTPVPVSSKCLPNLDSMVAWGKRGTRPYM